MKRITPATEQRLLTVIEKTAALVNAGADPNDAIVKAASEANVRASEIELIVHAYNTGATNRHRQDGEDPLMKSASFSLADTAKILETMYPDNVKTAAVIERGVAVSDAYNHSPAGLLERRDLQLKLAGANIDWRSFNGQRIETPAPLPVDTVNLQKQAIEKVRTLEYGVSEHRRKAAALFDQAGDIFTELAGYFRRPDAHPVRAVKEAAALLYGDIGPNVLDRIVNLHPTLEKLANDNVGARGKTGADLDCTKAPFPIITRLIEKLAEYNVANDEYANAVQSCTKEAAEIGRPFIRTASPSIFSEDPSSDSLRIKASNVDIPDPVKMLGTYSLMNRALGPAVAKLKGPDETSQMNRAMSQLNDPSHELRLREINTHALLNDLMTNDDVISGYDQDQVTNAFNNVTQLAPSVADQRMIMQGMLRRYLQQGQLDPFEQGQLLDFESKRRQQTQGPANANYA